MSTAKIAMSLLKGRLGPDGLISLLQPDIEDANAFWHNVINNSTTDGWKPADGQAIAFLPNVTAARFALWSQSPLADAVYTDLNPEHYVKRTEEVSPGVLQAEVLEGWGGITTYFTISNYGTPDREEHPFLRELPDFPIQAAGDKVLRDGTDALYGVLHISVRDVDGAEYGQPYNGIHVWATVWCPDARDDWQMEAEQEHMVVEIINNSLQVQKDIEDGVFVPPV